MDQGPQDREVLGATENDDTTTPPSGGFRNAVKRLRNVFTPRDSTKAAKRSSREIPGQATGGRQVQTPSPAASTPGEPFSRAARGYGFPSSPTEQLLQEIEARAEAVNPLAIEPAVVPFLQRPRPPQSTASEGRIAVGNAIDKPVQRLLSRSISQPTFEASSEPTGSGRRPPSPLSKGPHQTALPSRKDRATALFGKYGLDFDPEGVLSEEGPSDASVSAQRVRKPAKARVHYHCHRCGLAIGSDGICISCGHRRCRKCERWPEKKDEESSKSEVSARPSVPSPAPSSTRSETLDTWLADPRPSTSRPNRTFSSLFSRDHIWVTKAVQRLCHKCHSPFIWTQTRCQDCNHVVCDECPRASPASRDMSTLPTVPRKGQIGSSTQQIAPRVLERVLKKPRIRIRYNCEHCGTVFEESSKICEECQHMRCVNCPRYPPREEPEKRPSPQAVEAFAKRMASVQ